MLGLVYIGGLLNHKSRCDFIYEWKIDSFDEQKKGKELEEKERNERRWHDKEIKQSGDFP